MESGAYEEGCEAYQNGFSIDDNPYVPSSSLYNEWVDVYLVAFNDWENFGY